MSMSMNPSTSPKILVVDDDQMLREAISAELRRQKWSVTEAENGKIAFELVQCQKFDAVITDVRMPGGHGTELLHKIVNMPGPKPLVIMMTGFSDLNEVEARRQGAVALITKPFRGRDLVELIRRTANISMKAS